MLDIGKLFPVRLWRQRPEKQADDDKKEQQHETHNGIDNAAHRPLKDSGTSEEE